MKDGRVPLSSMESWQTQKTLGTAESAPIMSLSYNLPS
jgi:hypothetical protein